MSGESALFELGTALLIVGGAGFAAVAGLGVLRMADVYIRMHAATKAGTLGAGLLMIAVAVHFGTVDVVVRAVAAAAFLIMTAPVAAHMLGRAAYRTGVPLWERTVVDEWRAADTAEAGSADPLVPTPSPLSEDPYRRKGIAP